MHYFYKGKYSFKITDIIEISIGWPKLYLKNIYKLCIKAKEIYQKILTVFLLWTISFVFFSFVFQIFCDEHYCALSRKYF